MGGPGVRPATGLRIYNEVGLGIPRKNTKSTMASAAGLYMLDADGEPEHEVTSPLPPATRPASCSARPGAWAVGASRRACSSSPAFSLWALLSKRRKREGWSLRRAADEIGVSFNTIARVETGNLPDLDTYTKLANWLGLAGEERAEATTTTIDAITTHLQQDPALQPDDADRIARLVKDMYEALAKPLQAKAVHLRSAATFKPTAARMLGELLDDIRAALDADGAA